MTGRFGGFRWVAARWAGLFGVPPTPPPILGYPDPRRSTWSSVGADPFKSTWSAVRSN